MMVASRTVPYVLVGLIALGGCADAERIEPPTGVGVTHTVSFVGYVFDGATGDRLTSYEIETLVGTTPTVGTVDSDGRYDLGALRVWDDYTVLINASGYRPFRSHNPAVGLPAELAQSDDIADLATHRTLHFDAYVFPDDLPAPAVTFTVTTPLGAQPSGTLRLRPLGSSLLSDAPGEMPAGVPGQLWSNDEDLQAATIIEEFSDGTLNMAAGELVYGVTYQVSIFNVVGFQPLEDTYTAGVETDKAFQLEEELAAPLEVLASNHASCSPPASPSAMTGATVTIELNHDIEPHDTMYPGGAAEAADDGFSIVSPDSDADTVQNTLKQDVSDNAQERGVSITLAGTSLTISWNPSSGLASVDPDDPIDQVSYGGLGNIAIRRVGSPSSAATLAELLGTGTITCQ